MAQQQAKLASWPPTLTQGELIHFAKQVYHHAFDATNDYQDPNWSHLPRPPHQRPPLHLLPVPIRKSINTDLQRAHGILTTLLATLSNHTEFLSQAFQLEPPKHSDSSLISYFNNLWLLEKHIRQSRIRRCSINVLDMQALLPAQPPLQDVSSPSSSFSIVGVNTTPSWAATYDTAVSLSAIQNTLVVPEDITQLPTPPARINDSVPPSIRLHPFVASHIEPLYPEDGGTQPMVVHGPLQALDYSIRSSATTLYQRFAFPDVPVDLEYPKTPKRTNLLVVSEQEMTLDPRRVLTTASRGSQLPEQTDLGSSFPGYIVRYLRVTLAELEGRIRLHGPERTLLLKLDFLSGHSIDEVEVRIVCWDDSAKHDLIRELESNTSPSIGAVPCGPLWRCRERIELSACLKSPSISFELLSDTRVWEHILSLKHDPAEMARLFDLEAMRQDGIRDQALTPSDMGFKAPIITSEQYSRNASIKPKGDQIEWFTDLLKVLPDRIEAGPSLLKSWLVDGVEQTSFADANDPKLTPVNFTHHIMHQLGSSQQWYGLDAQGRESSSVLRRDENNLSYYGIESFYNEDKQSKRACSGVILAQK